MMIQFFIQNGSIEFSSSRIATEKKNPISFQLIVIAPHGPSSYSKNLWLSKENCCYW